MTSKQLALKAQERSRAQKFLGKLLIVLTLVSFLTIGLLLNGLQLVLQLTIRLSEAKDWRRAHKRLNGQLMYAILAQPIFVLYAWSRFQVSILLEDVRMLEDVDKEIFGIMIANHTYELDWMACFVMADQLGNLGAYKCFSKMELKYMPIIGWAYWMSDQLFVSRNWSLDRPQLKGQLDALLDYQQAVLGIFAEGTRWTPEKHREAVEFARARQLEPFKRHLFPRQRGFTYTLRHYLRLQANEPHRLDNKPIRLFNLEIAMPERLQFSDFLEGRPLRADVICEEVPLTADLREEALKSNDENDCPKLTALLHQIYRRKDEMLEQYESNGCKFMASSPTSGFYPVQSPWRAFTYWLAGMSFTYGTFVYLAWTRYARSTTFWSFALLLLSSGILLLRHIENESKPRNETRRAAKIA